MAKYSNNSTDYEVHKLFSEDNAEATRTQDTSMDVNTGEVGDNRGDNFVRTCEANTLVNVALTARIEMLEAENSKLQKSIDVSKLKPCLHIAHDDKLMRLYTGFISYMVLVNFFTFWGEFSYWEGRKDQARKQHRKSLKPIFYSCKTEAGFASM